MTASDKKFSRSCPGSTPAAWTYCSKTCSAVVEKTKAMEERIAALAAAYERLARIGDNISPNTRFHR